MFEMFNKKIFRLGESIKLPNPEGRTYIVPAQDSGYDGDQLFNSQDFPKYISGRVIGFKKVDSKYHPVCLMEPTHKSLRFLGKGSKYENMPRILDEICQGLLLQDGVIEARSVNLFDVPNFADDTGMFFPFWVSIGCIQEIYESYEFAVYNNWLRLSRTADKVYIHANAVRAVIVLEDTVRWVA